MMMMKVMVNMVTTITNDNVSCLSDRRGSSTVHETRIAGTGGAATSLLHIHTNSFISIHHFLIENFLCDHFTQCHCHYNHDHDRQLVMVILLIIMRILIMLMIIIMLATTRHHNLREVSSGICFPSSQLATCRSALFSVAVFALSFCVRQGFR